MVSYLQVEGLVKSFGDRVLFENLSLGVGEGQRIGLIAKNGTGKTTLLKPTTVTTPQGFTCICEQTLKGGCPPIRLFAYAKQQLCHCEAPSKYMDVAVW